MVVNAIKDSVVGSRKTGTTTGRVHRFCLWIARGQPGIFLPHRDVAAARSPAKSQLAPLGQIKRSREGLQLRKNDQAVFDFDRCIIIDPSRDYEDVLVIAEHAN